MTEIEWIEDYSVGNDDIDREHKQLIEQINHLYELLSQSNFP